MEHTANEKGTSQVLLKHLVDQILPRLRKIQARVDDGERLAEFDIDYLESSIQDANHNRRFSMWFPEYAHIAGKVAQLYEQIASKALENERAQKK